MATFDIVAAVSAEARLEVARRWLVEQLAETPEVLVLAPTRGATDDLLRHVCPPGSGLFGAHRATPSQLAAELAIRPLARAGLAPVSGLGVEALAARAVSVSLAKGELSYFEPVADAPGMARALAGTLKDLRGYGINSAHLAEVGGAPGADLARLQERYVRELELWSLADEASLWDHARDEAAASAMRHALLDLPLLLLDLAPPSLAEQRFLTAVCKRAPAALATLVSGDDEGRAAVRQIVPAEIRDLDTAADTASLSKLDRLRRRIFVTDAQGPAPEEAPEDEGFTLISAPGEGRECVEIARRIHALAAQGTGFDRVAILLRDPDAYLPLVEEALRRAAIPAYFTRGTIRPHPAGRAFLALLDCATEGLSASRFAEYLSLGQVPRVDESGAPPSVEVPWVAPEGDQLVFKTLLPPDAVEELEAAEAGTALTPPPAEPIQEDAPVVAGGLRTPRGWERLLVDTRVIGGLDRWQQRLRGLAEETKIQIRELASDDPGRIEQLESLLERLGNLESFALPVIEALDQLPQSAPWGEWLTALSKLASRVLNDPEKVLKVLAELRPMDRVGPVEIGEVRRVLAERLGFLRQEPATRPYGRVFVATIAEARGRSFEAVFLPGLAEGIFPRRALEDPLLLDEHRRRLAETLPTQTERVGHERLLLRIAAGAASSRLIVSYPNLDILQGRLRVPSFYALDLLRAAEGKLPDLDLLEARAAAGSDSFLGWPAPRESTAAIDDAEYDLSVLEPMLHRATGEMRGRGHFLIDSNERLARSLRTRWRRWRPKFSTADGIVDPEESTLQGLGAYRLAERPYSPTALQRYAACPYRFLLYAVHGLRVRENPVRLEQLDPLTRGSLFHEIQHELFKKLERREMLELSEDDSGPVNQVLAATVEEVAAKYHADLAPAIERVWRSEIEELHTDLRGWVQSLIAARETWRPARFEMAFGLRPGQVSLDMRGDDTPLEAARIGAGRLLRGAIDLVEEHPERPALRVTDHKTGRAPKRGRLVVDGGKILQPVLYGLAAEHLLGTPVEAGRLSYCTRRGKYQSIEVTLDEDARSAAEEVLREIDDALERGFLPAAPDEGACQWCDYRTVCGPNEETRIRRKHPQRLARLAHLRAKP